MKIALCLSGQPRSFERGYEYTAKNLLNNYDCDVFCHTWMYDFFDYGKLFKLYSPKSVIIEQNLDSDFPKNFRYCPYNILASFYSVYKSILSCTTHEKENSIKYDWIVRSRFDFALNFNPKFEVLDPNIIYVPPSIGDVCSDQFAIGSSENMEKYSFTYINVAEFIKNGVDFGGERYVTENLKKYNLWNSKKFLDMKDPFPPGMYDSLPNCLIRDEFEFWFNK